MPTRVVKGLLRWLKRGFVALLVVAVAFLGFRAYVTQRGPPLEAWHTYVPEELSAAKLDAVDWNEYLKAEERIFESVRAEVSQKLEPEARVPINRYFADSPIYPARFAQDWNRSYVLEPQGKPLGAVVLLHGLTDSPYSLRHIAKRYRERGFVVVAIRLPGHGTVPAGLTSVEWEEWMAATRLAVREARRRTEPSAPLHLIGFSNGGALATKYALEALENRQLARPDRIVLISPMIGITRFARFAGVAGLPALLPAFAEAAWLGVVPEFNPFKYNSFPVNGARQTHRLTVVLQEQIARLAREGKLDDIAPVITFQSVMDFTVSAPAIVSALYAHLPANGSELVLYDVNRTVKFGPLLRARADSALERIMPPLPQRFRITIIANANPDSQATVERTIAPGETTAQVRELGIDYPRQIFSLSHVAIPFPLNDSLYGMEPDPGEPYGINLGTINVRGERGVLLLDLDSLFRIASNPFFPYMLARIEEGIDDPAPRAAKPPDPKVPYRTDYPAPIAYPPDLPGDGTGP